jgi:hypothetical protein
MLSPKDKAMVDDIHHAQPEDFGAKSEPIALSDEKAHEMAQKIIDSGVKLPPELRHPHALAVSLQKINDFAIQGEHGRDWYPRAVAVARVTSEIFGYPLKTVIDVMARYSAADTVTGSMKVVRKALEEFRATGDIKTLSAGGEHAREDVLGILRGEGWEGQKTNPFAQNMYREVPELNQYITNPESLTMDRHSTKLASPTGRDQPGDFYPGFEATYQAVAEHLGWHGTEVQAASWVTQKAKSIIANHEKRMLARGYTYTPIPWDVAVGRARDAYEKGFMRHAMTGDTVSEYLSPELKARIKTWEEAATSAPQRPEALAEHTQLLADIKSELEANPGFVAFKPAAPEGRGRNIGKGALEAPAERRAPTRPAELQPDTIYQQRTQGLVGTLDRAAELDPSVQHLLDGVHDEIMQEHRTVAQRILSEAINTTKNPKAKSELLAAEHQIEHLGPPGGTERRLQPRSSHSEGTSVKHQEASVHTPGEPRLDAEAAAFGEKAHAHYHKDPVGFTLEVTGEPAQTSRYIHSIEGHEETGAANKEAFAKYFADHKAALEGRKGRYFGAWDHEGNAVKDISTSTDDLAEAQRQGALNNQHSLWDSKANKAIRVTRTRVEQLRIDHDKALDEIADAKYGATPRNAEANRSRSNRVAAKQRMRGGKRQEVKPSVREERRRMVEKEIQDAIARDPENPKLKEWKDRLAEIEAGTPPDAPHWMTDEAGSVTPGAFLHEPRGLDTPYEPRTITAGGLTAQAQKPRSRIAQQLTRLFDSASSRLDKSVVSEKRGIRLLTSHERVVSLAGRAQRVDSSRRPARFYGDLNTISKLNEGSPEDTANFWYAQLPKTHRNAKGLSLVRGKQHAELEHITSGAANASIDEQLTAVKAKLKDAESGAEAGKLLREQNDLHALQADLPRRVEDISASIANLDKLIANPPAVHEAALASVQSLSSDRERILREAEGRTVNEDTISNRKGLVSGWLGLDTTGDESYVGHRLARPENFGGSFGHTGGTGKVKTPQGVGSQNQLVLATNGRLRSSLHVAAEDWQQAQVFEQANIARKDLSAVGKPFEGHVPKGYVLVNPRGKTLPAHWRTDELAQFHEDVSDIADIRQRATEIVDGFIARNPAAIEEMKQAALESGQKWNELRVVPERLVHKYYKQYRGRAGEASAVGKAYDRAIDAVSASIVFGRVGYIPKNLVQNLIMAVPHQGALLPINAARAAQVLRDPEIRHLLHGDIGFTGATGALSKETTSKKVLGAITEFVSKIADDPARMSAFLHEAAAEGVIGGRSGYSRVLLNQEDKANLIRLFTDPKQRQRLNDIRSRSVEAMADFSRLTPDQSHMARRFFIIPGWLAAGSRYPFHFATTHPIRSALLAYAAAGEPGAPPGLSFNQPITDYIHGSGYLRGVNTPWGRERVSSIDPVTTPWQLGESVAGSVRGKTGPFDYSTPTVMDEAQPLGKAIIGVASGQGIKRSLMPLAPNVKLATSLFSPSPSTHYPGDVSRVGRIKREVGVLPTPIVDSSTRGNMLRAAWRFGQMHGGNTDMYDRLKDRPMSDQVARQIYRELLDTIAATKQARSHHG